MKKQDILQRSGLTSPRPRMNRWDWFRLLPLLFFLASSVLVLLPAPVIASTQAASATSMSTTPVYLHPAKPKAETTVAPQHSLVLQVSCFQFFYSFSNYFTVASLFPSTTTMGTAIRAPPFFN